MIYLIAFSEEPECNLSAKASDEDSAEIIANLFSACADKVYRVGLFTYLLHKITFYNTSSFLADQFGREWVNELRG